VDSCSDDSRCLIIKLKLLNNVYLKIISVYFPCYSGSSEYKIELGHSLGFLDNNILFDESVIVLGDMNFECDNNSAGFTQCSEVFSSAGIACCDYLVRTNSECVTYCNTSLGQASFIDHIFVSRRIIDRVMNVDILHSDVNLSDHRPIAMDLLLRVSKYRGDQTPKFTSHQTKPLNWRWDKSDLCMYYEASREELSDITVPCELFNVHINVPNLCIVVILICWTPR